MKYGDYIIAYRIRNIKNSMRTRQKILAKKFKGFLIDCRFFKF